MSTRYFGVQCIFSRLRGAICGNSPYGEAKSHKTSTNIQRYYTLLDDEILLRHIM